MRVGQRRTNTAPPLLLLFLLAALVGAISGSDVRAQKRTSEIRRSDRRGPVRAITIPVTVRPSGRAQTELQTIDFMTVLEDEEPQQILSVRGANRAPLALAVLIQDDIVSSIGNEIRGLAAFIRRLPPGSRVLVGYLRAGSLQVRQRFTTDLERAASSLRIPISSSSAAPYNPYVQTIEALRRFDAQPTGRRAVLLISDGLDASRGISSSSPSQSTDLQRAINEAQRRGTPIYSFYAPTVSATATGSQILTGNGQGALEKLSSETGGRAFFQGRGAPVSFDPFLRELNTLLARQFALTYLSTHSDKGFHRIRVVSDLAGEELQYPAGYVR